MKKVLITILYLSLMLNFCFGQLETQPLVIGEKFELYAKSNETTYQISVCLPKNYQTDTLDYPVLYLFYGGEQKFLAASGIATSLFEATWQTPKMIIVGITNIQWTRDLTPVYIEGREGSGGAQAFHSFVTKNLLKTIDDNYRTTDHRIFMGHSFGGLFGIYSFMENPDTFDDYILVSPSIAQRADYIETALKEKIKNSEDLKNKFYYSVGSEGARMTKSILWIEDGLSSKYHEEVKWKLERFEGHNHHSHTQASLINGLLFIFEGYEDE